MGLMETIWREYYARMVVFVGPMVRDQSHERFYDVDDVVQEIMVKVMINIDRYNPNFSFNTWIYTIARNHCRDLHRRAALRGRRSSQQTPEETPAGQAGPEEELLRKEAAATVHRYLEGLSSAERQIAFLRFSERMTYEEIGRTLGMPSGTVKYRIHEIRKGLEYVLETAQR